ncbi:DNA sulfur modification protein DndE [Burkholderia contaminans]|uniref:DNA sulfur modification protein DndE n=2 Tax=Burkholderia contaminans TaxID=488447 RepID=UPI001F38F3B8|nr:DNA sulfur modification protein DndE [Burkholderia contaminans]MEB4633720.1 DNA sulfur modification protein DndE [Burkholderia contaminans]MEB4638565.1 DNA sulfur modification protein DndE [Burkholderia contaminans]MEB4657621.1 DNA sulfur modification protein DndE [Burkholderia contaminans]MEB4665577.1 DNA sulfur modification protein DndE [Burkholderia contaminans]MEB4671721.1 DNA sulfur modification protein DndE [Burkholderia contaminans]
MSVIERVKLTSIAKNQLIALKRKTGIEHNNVLCRHALCLSLANASAPPEETFNFSGGLEIDWRTFTGGNEGLYSNLIIVRLLRDKIQPTPNSIRQALLLHLHRGLSYLASRREEDLLIELARAISS